MTAQAFPGEIARPDGRYELTPEADAALGTSSLHNEDLAPVPIAKRTWTTYNYLSLWVGMSINIPSWLLASGLIALGMSWVQAIVTIFLGNLIVLVPMLLISHGGTKYGVPYPVLARASFGVFGANLPALIRAGVACGWFGIQTWIGGTALFAVLSALLGPDSWWATAGTISIGIGVAASQPWTLWLSFAIFWALNIVIILWGMDAIKRFEAWAAPFLIAVFLGLMVWMIVDAGGLGPVVDEPGTLGWGEGFWNIFPISLMGMIAFWSTLSLNMPDFTRFGRSQREQAIGQALGLPTTMTIFPLVGVLTTSATVIVFGEAIWDPVALTARMENPIILLVMLATLAIATLTTNVAANVVSPSYDFSNVWPKRISFRTGGIITGILGILIMPWNLLNDPNSYIFTWLGTYGGATGAIAGVLIADYWVLRGQRLHLADLYKADGMYRYASGWNWIAVVSLLVGIVFAIGGANSASGAPFPVDGFIPALRSFYDYSWVVGLVIAFVVYWGLTKALGQKDAA
ncbi:MAG TPA: NCS1 family nucleobase:cation symporter-1 [Candidatus Sulfomarinibacteraceae bacterium]|nr:NCS1 family nucleobase:cation symporter-1 [Candidatus Sulfomarinibacteraceae bacterium]